MDDMIVGNQTVRLMGIRPGPQYLLPSLVKNSWTGSRQGPHRNAVGRRHSSRYQCSTDTGENIAEAALLAGVGRCRRRRPSPIGRRTQERRKGNGLWARP